MTERKHLKARIRARMARTGERYVTARRHVVGDQAPAPAIQDDHGYRLRGGVHQETATIANLLANLGVSAGGEPLSEALILGAGGGLGAGYILWEFQAHHARALVLGFRNQWQYPDRWTAKVFERLGVEIAMHHTGGAVTAAAQLDGALARGVPAIAWVDRQSIGHWHLPKFLEGHVGQPVVVYGSDGGRVRIDDRNLAPLTADRGALDAARSRIGSYKHRLVVAEPRSASIPADRLRAAVAAGLVDCAEHLSQRSDSFSLPAWRKWARLLTDTRNAKAWPRVFADPTGLVGALVSTYDGIEPIGVAGGNLRVLFADFLDEAAAIVEQPALTGVAASFREIAGRWHELAEAALSDDQPDFAAMRDLLAGVHASVIGDGDAGAEAAAEAAGRLWELRATWRRATPFDAAATDELFADLSGRLQAIYEAETAAVAALGKITTNF